jgi:hypothetical protein
VLEYCHGCDRLVQWAVSETARAQVCFFDQSLPESCASSFLLP